MASYTLGAPVPARKILAYLNKQMRGVSIGALEEEFHTGQSNIKAGLNELKDKGQIIIAKDAQGKERYMIPDVGLIEGIDNALGLKSMSRQEADKARRAIDRVMKPKLRKRGLKLSDLSREEFTDLYIECLKEVRPDDERLKDEEKVKHLRSVLIEVATMQDDLKAGLKDGSLDPIRMGEVFSETDIDAGLQAIKGTQECLDEKNVPKTGAGRPHITPEVRSYREDVCLYYLKDHPMSNVYEIAQNHVVDPDFGRLTPSQVRDTLNIIYGTNGNWLLRTSGKNNMHLWSLGVTPTNIDERIDQRVKEINAKKDIYVIEPELPQGDAQTFSTGPDAKKEEKDMDKDGVMRIQAENVSVSVKADDVKVDGTIVPPKAVPTTEMSENDEVLEYEFVIHGEEGSVKPIIGSIKDMCKLSEAQVAARVLAKASNREVTVQVVTVSTVIRCKPDDS